MILYGMSANPCTESHIRDLLWLGFEVAVVKAVVAAIAPAGAGLDYSTEMGNVYQNTR